MELPIELVGLLTALVGGGVTYLVVNGIKGVGEWFGKDLTPFAVKFAALASASAVALSLDLINFGIESVPAEYMPVVTGAFSFLVVLLGAVGVHRNSKK